MDQEEVEIWMSVYHITVHLENGGLYIRVPREINYVQLIQALTSDLINAFIVIPVIDFSRIISYQ
jgi:hypothetical protein